MKGIMFKEPLFNAILRGQKTQTRRVIKIDFRDGEILTDVVNGEYPEVRVETDLGERVIRPKYKPGEVVYMKEPYNVGEMAYYYKFDGKPLAPGFDWKNKMFMPESAARYFIKITGVRVERLQEINMGDIIAEGCTIPIIEWGATFQDDWKSLWNSINKPPHDWTANPWVWAYEFELTEKQNQ